MALGARLTGRAGRRVVTGMLGVLVGVSPLAGTAPLVARARTTEDPCITATGSASVSAVAGAGGSMTGSQSTSGAGSGNGGRGMMTALQTAAIPTGRRQRQQQQSGSGGSRGTALAGSGVRTAPHMTCHHTGCRRQGLGMGKEGRTAGAMGRVVVGHHGLGTCPTIRCRASRAGSSRRQAVAAGAAGKAAGASVSKATLLLIPAWCPARLQWRTFLCWV